MNKNTPLILIRGGGDLASGVAIRLHRAGLNLLITENPQPLAVRRQVSFAEAVYQGKYTVENVTARLAPSLQDAHGIILRREIPILVDPTCEMIISQEIGRAHV